MQDLALTIAPIFVIVVLGNVLRRLGLPGDAFWPQASRLGYWVLIPSLLFYKLSTAEVDIDLMAPFTLGLGGAFFLVGFVILLVSGLAGMSGAQLARSRAPPRVGGPGPGVHAGGAAAGQKGRLGRRQL